MGANMKIRPWSYTVGAVWGLFGAFAYWTLPRFVDQFCNCFNPPTLGPVAKFVIYVTPCGWLLLSLAVGVGTVMRDCHPATRRIPTWVSVVVLAMCMCVYVLGLFYEMIQLMEALRQA